MIKQLGCVIVMASFMVGNYFVGDRDIDNTMIVGLLAMIWYELAWKEKD